MSKFTRVGVALAAFICLEIASPLFAQPLVRVGVELQVNTYTTSDQRSPDVALDGDGDFVVVWTSAGQDGSQGGAFGRRFGSAGGALGSEFLSR